jgi:hypothetical protein
MQHASQKALVRNSVGGVVSRSDGEATEDQFLEHCGTVIAANQQRNVGQISMPTNS